MQDGLRDVITAAAAGGARQADLPSAAGRVTPLRAVDPPAATTPPSLPFLPDADHLGRGGLRLAFWLCGLQEALLERQRQGGRLTPREELLLALSRQDFISLRPTVTGMALAHLDAIVNDADLLTAPEMPPVAAELFALDTVRSLAARGAQTLRELGAEAALALFGGDGTVQNPLAVFQLVFSAALGLVETLQRLAPAGSETLSRLAAALDAEIGRI